MYPLKLGLKTLTKRTYWKEIEKNLALEQCLENKEAILTAINDKIDEL